MTTGGLLIGQGTSAVTTTGVLSKGSLIVGDGVTDPTTLTVGSDGSVLRADASQAAGVKWGTACLPIGSSESEDQNSNFKLVWPVPVAGSLSQFAVAVGSAPGSGKSWSVTASGGSANLSCTISGTATSCTTTGTATFSAGNVLTVAFARSGGGISSTQGSGWSACFLPD